MNEKRRKIFALGYSDNTSTSYLLDYLIKSGIIIDGIIFPKSQFKRSWKRLIMKFKLRGIIPVIKRIFENVFVRKNEISEICIKNIKQVFFVDQINSEEVRDILINNHVRLLLLTATPIIKSIIIGIDGLKILNPHTGWLPDYRGLDANLKALRDGRSPGVSIHMVTEKIDAGEIYLREKFEIDYKKNILKQMDQKELELSGRLFVKAINMYRENKLKPIIIAEQLSKYETPLSIKEKKRILKKVKREALQPKCV